MSLPSPKNSMPFNGHLGLVQRVLPSYRAPFFDALAHACSDGLSVFAGSPLLQESIQTVNQLKTARLTLGKNWHIFNPQSPFYLCHQPQLIHWLKSQNPQALIIEANFRYTATPAAIHWMKQQKRPVLGWGLGAPSQRGLLNQLRNQFLNQFDALIAYSVRGAQEYIACGFPAERVFVAPNAVTHAPKLAPTPKIKQDSSPQPVVLFVGRLQARKRVSSLIKACAALPAQLQPRLIIVGDGPELNILKEHARISYPSTEFVGAKHDQELIPYFEMADLFVLPGTGGLAVQQAMSFGLPIIVAKGDGTQDDLVRPENGWQIAAEDDFALLFAMQEALSNLSVLPAMGQVSYKIVAEEINLEKMVAVFLQAIQSCSTNS